MAKVYAFCNRKGGAGKTTLAYNFACYLQKHHGRTLLVDLDSQAHATIHAGLNPFQMRDTVYEFFLSFLESGKVNASPLVEASELTLVPSSERVAALEVELSKLDDAETQVLKQAVLREILLEFRDDFEYIVLDTPPSLGLLTINALVASDFFVIPFRVDFFSMVGIGEMMSVYYRLNATYSPSLKLLGLVPFNFTPRTNVAREILSNVRRNFGERMILPELNQDIKFVEAASHGLSIFSYAPKSKGAQQMGAVAEEIIRRSS